MLSRWVIAYRIGDGVRLEILKFASFRKFHNFRPDPEILLLIQ